MRIGLINNLRAGRNEKNVGRLLESLGDMPEVHHIETSCAGAVPEALWEFANHDVELLVVNGGDGTLQSVLTEILGHGAFDGRVPMIAPLRGGRTNMTALDIGATRDPVRALASLVHDVRTARLYDRIVMRNVLRVEYGVQRDFTYGMFFGAGAIPRTIDLVHRVFPKGRAQGVFGGTVMTAGLLARLAVLGDAQGILSPEKARIVLDRALIAGDQFTLMMASTLGRLFAGMRPFWGEGPGPVRFTAIRSGAKGLLRASPGLVRGKSNALMQEKNGYISRNAQTAEMRIDGSFTVDGEIIGEVPGGRIYLTGEEVVPFVRA
jgi:diacylglycerol kinase (ATP)